MRVARRERLDALDELVARVDVDARLLVGDRHEEKLLPNAGTCGQ